MLMSSRHYRYLGNGKKTFVKVQGFREVEENKAMIKIGEGMNVILRRLYSDL